MALSKYEQPYFTFAKGINTEASLANWPAGFSVDELNYNILKDGSRRKRKGLVRKDSVSYTDGAGLPVIPTNLHGGYKEFRSFRWENVSNIGGLNFYVIQVAGTVYVYQITGETYTVVYAVELSQYSNGAGTVSDTPIDASFGNGDAFIVGKYTYPFYISYDESTDSFIDSKITIIERDFQGYDDGILLNTTPTTLSDEHRYNLLNRGWKDSDITSFFAANSVYPSKAMAPMLGYTRKTTAGTSEADWTRTFSPTVYLTQLFQDVSAPQGHFKINSGATTTTSTDTTNDFAVDAWSTPSYTPGVVTVTVTTDKTHGLTAGDHVVWSGNKVSINGSGSSYRGGVNSGVKLIKSFDGYYEVLSTPTTTTFTIQVTLDSDWPTVPFGFSGTKKYKAKGTIQTISTTTVYAANPDRLVNPEVTAFWMGRIWFMGNASIEGTNKIYFSQIIENEDQYGRCYQQADPTDEKISDIVASDGGFIRIPEASVIRRALVFGGSLLVFASNGVWQITPGADGYFAPTAYGVRKVADVGIVGKKAAIIAENTPFFVSQHDIYMIKQDPQQGFLFAQNITQNTIHSLYNDIPYERRQYMSCSYDPFTNELYFFYMDDVGEGWPSGYYPSRYEKAVVLNLILGAFTRWEFSGVSDTKYIIDAFAMQNKDIENEDQMLQFLVMSGNGTTGSGYFHTLTNDSTYTDFATIDGGGVISGGTAYDAYVVAGYALPHDPVRHKEGEWVWVFSNKTEKGYISDGSGGFTPVNPSSTKMQARWDWADDFNSGKWGTAQQVYRQLKSFTPSTDPADLTDEGYYPANDGIPLIVTKNKIRGKGRALALKFTGEHGKASWIAGWYTNLKVIK